MRIYIVQVRDNKGKWISGAKKHESCRKAHSAARDLGKRNGGKATRVITRMQQSRIKLPQ